MTTLSEVMGMRGTILMLCVVLALVGCEESTMVGSGCPSGACPEALVRDDDACTVITTISQIAVVTDPEVDWSFSTVCLPEPLERGGDGLINASVYYLIPSSVTPQIGCTERPFLKPVSQAIRAQYLEGHSGAELCELAQLAVVHGDGGEPVVAAGDGYYYDDFSAEAEEECIDAPLRITVTEEARPWNGVIVTVATAEKRDADGDVDPSITCEPIKGTEPIGTKCSLERSEYFDSEAIIATRSDACGQGVCLAYHLGGKVSDEGCASSDVPEGGVHSSDCASEDEIDARMYCSCRCDGPPGAEDLCACPDGFSCVGVMPDLVPDVAGSYCVKNGQQVD